jgi:acetyl/propionyl-CoA carboxylase alpha subunit
MSAAETYLDVEKLMKAARQSGAGAIHPGYGFLSEKVELAIACEREGIIFIGPPIEAIRLMGDKALSKGMMKEGGVPTIPGFVLNPDPGEWEENLHKARELGFPVMVKAAAGGGGKGMRRVDCVEEFSAAVETCASEARSSFADDRLLVEKYIMNPRHIEVQIFGDNYGNLVHVNERECSIQRRNQKIIEECPAPRLAEKIRRKMRKAALLAAQLVHYRNAGTVEFVLGEDSNFYFLEMNTRIQVEHPVTEMVHSVDLVQEQIRVALGYELSMTQEPQASGHAIEVRIYAEAPLDENRPSCGKIVDLQWPDSPGQLRIDTGIQKGSEVSPFFDPMLAKIIAHGSTRKQARQIMTKALEDLVLLGVETNVSYLLTILRDESFAEARLHTGFLDENKLDEKHRKEMGQFEVVDHALAHVTLLRTAAVKTPDPFIIK